MKLTGRLTATLAAALALAPAVAAACPACAGRQDGNPWASAALLGGLLSVPYVIGVVVVRIVRRLDDESLIRTKVN